MFTMSHHAERTKKDNAALRYWLAWALIVATLCYSMHRYFEYRNHELDKRLEKLRQ